MQLKKSYHIATNVCSRKSATTFGDLPDCSYGYSQDNGDRVCHCDRCEYEFMCLIAIHPHNFGVIIQPQLQ